MAGTKKTQTLGPVHELSDEENRKAGLQAARHCKDKEDLSNLLEALGIKSYVAKEIRQRLPKTEEQKEAIRRRKALRKQYYLFPEEPSLTHEELEFAFPQGVPAK